MPDYIADSLFPGQSSKCNQDGVYRWELAHVWDPGTPPILWIMLNPSTADAFKDDPTMTRVIRFSGNLGYGGCTVLNLFSYRATDPTDLRDQLNPNPLNAIGAHTDEIISRRAGEIDHVMCAWGSHGPDWRVKQVWELIKNNYCLCLGTTKSGAPRHPLYLKNGSTLKSWTL